ncbi:MAG TPA: hemolysin family protein [Parvularculaceae bacterium]|nr:hemolysin family protein [Parvularculaceae bacterium]
MEGEAPSTGGDPVGEGASAAAFDPDEAEDGPSGNFFSKLFGFWTKPSDESLAEAFANGEAVKRLPRARREMIERVIAFDEKRVSDVMAPRADIIAVDVDTGLDDLIRAFAEAGHSRLPIFRGDLDNPLGMVHVKDVVELIAHPEKRQTNAPILKQIRRDALYVPPSMRITDLLLKMQASRIHMALVIDEYGGTDGLVTIEDLVEEIVGDINDEHDEDETPIVTRRAGGGFDVDARMELSDFAAETGVAFEAEDDEVDTLGGFVVSLAGRVPQRGEVISDVSGYDFEVLEADARKIRKLRMRPRRDSKEPAAGAAI